MQLAGIAIVAATNLHQGRFHFQGMYYTYIEYRLISGKIFAKKVLLIKMVPNLQHLFKQNFETMSSCQQAMLQNIFSSHYSNYGIRQHDEIKLINN